MFMQLERPHTSGMLFCLVTILASQAKVRRAEAIFQLECPAAELLSPHLRPGLALLSLHFTDGENKAERSSALLYGRQLISGRAYCLIYYSLCVLWLQSEFPESHPAGGSSHGCQPTAASCLCEGLTDFKAIPSTGEIV